ncbi:MAG: hypothetical protein U0796_14050 [Gemmatales bacterium]
MPESMKTEDYKATVMPKKGRDPGKPGKKPSKSGLLTTSDNGTIKIRWIKIIEDNATGGGKKLLFAGTQTGSTNLQGGYFMTSSSSFDTWFALLLASFKSTDGAPVMVTYTTDPSVSRRYSYYEEISGNPISIPDPVPVTALILRNTTALT